MSVVTQRPQSTGEPSDSVDTTPEELCAPQIAPEAEVLRPTSDAHAQPVGQFAGVGVASASTNHAAPAPAATAFIAQWKPVITQAWMNQP